MNDYQRNLFAQLETLIAGSEAFYRQEFVLDSERYWIYNYRLASYTDFLQPGALECRGVMFRVDAAGHPVELAALPMAKYFNLEENPMTIGLDLTKVDTIELKADGSLISTYTDVSGVLRMKSKGSLFSDQALAAELWLRRPDQDGFHQNLTTTTEAGYTVNMEWCAPDNRIVIGYLKPHLRVLNVRHRESGQYMSRDQIESIFGENVIDRIDLNGLDAAAFVRSIPAMTDDIEGYVARIGDLWFKIKTEKYMSLHHAKDSITNPRRLFESIIDEGVDDLRSMFSHDALAIATIDAMQQRVVTMYNHFVTTVEQFHATNKDLSRKDYAIKGQQELDRMYFGLAMSKYLGQPVDYKAYIKSKWKELGFRDEATNE
jgi:T4 RnlA family RNA ligase